MTRDPRPGILSKCDLGRNGEKDHDRERFSEYRLALGLALA